MSTQKLNQVTSTKLPIQTENNFIYTQSDRNQNHEYINVNKNENKPLPSANLPFQLEWKDINITFQKKKTIKNILENVNGIVKSGEMLAILGSSGAGKTTLLNFLSRKIQSVSLKSTGKVTLNNEELNDNDFSCITSYVMQDDILEPTMTAKEILLFTAHLQMKDESVEKQEERVKSLLSLLKIEKCQNTRIGDNLNRGVSGGERKRVSIAVELLSDSPIIFLDEPTTGLDSYNAYEVISALRHLAFTMNKIIIFTIHQPASEIFELLDKLHILSLGRTVFFGDKKDLFEYYNMISLPFPENYNPFEHIIEKTALTAIESDEILSIYPDLNKIENKQEKYSEYIKTISSLFINKFVKEKVNNKENSKVEEIPLFIKDHMKSKDQSSFFYETYKLILRNLIKGLRNKKFLLLKIFQNIIIGIIVSLIYSEVLMDFTGVRDKLGLLNMFTVLTVFNAVNSNVTVFSEERQIFLRERSNKLYSPFAYYISKVFDLIPFTIIPMNLLSIICYYSVNLNPIAGYKFWVFIGIMNLVYFSAGLKSLFIGSLSSSIEILSVIIVMINVNLLILGGFYSPQENFVPYLFPFKYISLFKWSYQLLLENEFNDNFYTCQNPPSSCNPLIQYNFTESIAVDFAVTSAIGVIFAVIGYILVYYKLRNRL